MAHARTSNLLLVGAAVAALAPFALAQEVPPADPPAEERPTTFGRDPDRWEISFEPSAWYVGISGKIRLPRSTTSGSPAGKVTLEDLNLDNPSFEPTAEINARRGDWRATLRAAYFGAERNASGLSGSLGDLSFAPGERLRTGLDFTVIELEGAYTFAGSPRGERENGSFAIDPRLDVVFGARVYNEQWSVTNLDATSGVTSVEESGWFVQPLVGLKLSADLYEELTLDAQMTVGGLPSPDTNYSVDIVVGFQWRPTRNVGIQMGYRSLFFGMSEGSESNEFTFDGSLQGLYGGLVLRF
jgi:opacity protein-like surface antigen